MALAGRIILALCFLAFGFGAQAAVEKRVALVIGNSAYRNAAPLANPERDARAVADKLRGLGFAVIEGYDLDHRQFQSTIQDFARAVRGAALGAFYYAGHGIQVGGRNYAIPVDAAFADSTALDFEAVPVDLVMRQMQTDVGVRLVVLDACRDNPLSRTLARSMSSGARSTAPSSGLAEVKVADTGEGTAIIFATSPDEVALDGEGEHSPFTAALLRNIDAPDVNLQTVMSRITGEVVASTKQRQRPWLSTSLTGEVFLNPQTKAAPALAAAPATVASGSSNDGDNVRRETALYNLARDSGQAEDYRAYLETFPSGLFIANARNHLERIDREKSAKPVVASLAPASEAAPSRALEPAAEMTLPITDALKAMPGTEATEAQLELTKDKRRELQTRLKLSGFGPGAENGVFGAKTRDVVARWQASLGLPATGYLNPGQYELLMVRTQTAFAAYVPAKPAAPVAAQKKRVGSRQDGGRRRDPERSRSARPSYREDNSEQIGQILNVIRAFGR